MTSVTIIGGGAAGCFCAVNIKRLAPAVKVVVLEAALKPLAKVALTGGGRCNLTNSFQFVKNVQQAYPRGANLMKRALRTFSHTDAFRWFEDAGVRLVTQPDGCVFPRSQDAQQIVTTLRDEMTRLGVVLRSRSRVTSVSQDPSSAGYVVSLADGSQVCSDVVVVTTGGSPTAGGLRFLQSLQLEFEPPVPSLFSLSIDNDDLHSLMGIVVPRVVASVAGTKFKADGPLLVTHWGISGPAILKLSSYAARHLALQDYKVNVVVDWTGGAGESAVLQAIDEALAANLAKSMSNVRPFAFTQRHWEFLLLRAGIPASMRAQEVTQRHKNKLVATLTADTYATAGKTRHHDEFVTCGGVSLRSVDQNTLQASLHPGLFFAGEVLDVDAITGGFNLQAAWSMAMVVARQIALMHSNSDC